jgi:hypothetical protein
MSVTRIKELLHAAPFQPFTVHMADGGALRIPHPDFAATLGTGRFLIICDENSENYDLVDVVLVTRVTVEAQNVA